MPRSWCLAVIVTGFISVLTATGASAQTWTTTRIVYYWPPYSYCAPITVPLQSPYANPTPAPPSGQTKMPTISTMRSPGAEEPSTGKSSERCRVGFWNLSGGDVVLTVSGRSWTLPGNQSVTMDVSREFTWQVAGKAQHLERVPAGQSAYEVVVR